MKKLMVLLLTGCLVVMSQSFREVAADDDNGGRISARALEGTYSVTQHGSLFFCVSDTSPFPPVQCASAHSLGFPLTLLDVGSSEGR